MRNEPVTPASLYADKGYYPVITEEVRKLAKACALQHPQDFDAAECVFFEKYQHTAAATKAREIRRKVARQRAREERIIFFKVLGCYLAAVLILGLLLWAFN